MKLRVESRAVKPSQTKQAAGLYFLEATLQDHGGTAVKNI